MGELRSMIMAIPGAEEMFSHIQAALVKAGSSNRIKLDRSTRDKLRDSITSPRSEMLWKHFP